jgi:antitoxin Phd
MTREVAVRWQLQEAKAKLSELVKRAESEGPQEITVHGEAKAVLLSKAEYERLTGGKKPNLVDFIRNSPLYGLDLQIERDETPLRATEIDFSKMFDNDAS